ncbi:hypothetical protein L218DRAFT_901416 [Marasmius fiardii PR-910]|nr:hypothetical protein L218DRAFT_901416 [Marasmius fiardii PR-910]
MADPADAYTALTPSSSRSEVAKILQSIIIAPGFTINESTRTKLLKLLLNDIKNRGSDSRITDQDANQAILAVKMLGRNPQGSNYLATETGLSDLLIIASSLLEKDNLGAGCEALRCIANAMLLFEGGRSTFLTEEVNGGEICMQMLNKATTSDEIFILSRILFFATVSQSPFVIWLVEEKHDGRSISQIIEEKVTMVLARYLKNTKANLAQEAIADLLKFTFNLLLYYPKMVDCDPQSSSLPSLSEGEARIMGDFWSPKLDGFLSPMLQLYLSLPPPNTEPTPLQPPLSSSIHSLITIPVNATLRSKWFEKLSPEGPDVVQHTQDLLDKSLAYYFPKSEPSDSESIRDFAKSKHPSDELDDILSPLIILATRLCIGDLSARKRICDWIVPPDMDRDPENPLDERPNVLGRCIRLMGSVYHKRLKESAGELLYAMCGQDAGVLSSKVGYGHVAGFLFEKGVMSAPAPATDEGEGGSSTTAAGAGTSSSTSGIEEIEDEGEGEGTGARTGLESEMTFAGPSNTRQVNPITGTYVPERTSNPMDDMSEEEKEREMEKLFVLFDRMEKTGALNPEQNPVRKAIQKSMQQ